MKMRFPLSICATLLSFGALAANDAPPPPLPDNADPGPAMPDPAAIEPEITIVPKKEGIHEEYRVNGRLYMIKVTPKAGGPSYYLMDPTGEGRFIRSDLEPQIRVPQWVIKEF